MQADVLPLFEPDQRAGDGAVDGKGMTRSATCGEVRIADGERDIFTRKFSETVLGVGQRTALRPSGHGQSARGGKASGAGDELTSVEGGFHTVLYV